MNRPANLRREILFQLTDVARTMRTYIDQRAREHGMTRAQWGVLVRLERQEGMTQAEMAESSRDPADLARAPDRPAVPSRPRRAASASARQAGQPALPDRQGPRHARAPRSRSAGRSRRTSCASLDEADVADLLQKLLLIRNNIRQAAGKRGVADGAQGNCVRNTRDGRQRVHAAANVCRAHAADAVAARDADGDHSRRSPPRSGSIFYLVERTLRFHRQCLRRRPEGADHA